MRRLASMVILLLLAPLLAGSVRAQEPGTVAGFDAADRARLAEAFRLAEELGDEVWPGWSEAPFPVLLVTPERELLVRHPEPPAGFTRVGHDSTLGADVYSRPRVFPAGLLATFPIGGPLPVVVIGWRRALHRVSSRGARGGPIHAVSRGACAPRLPAVGGGA